MIYIYIYQRIPEQGIYFFVYQIIPEQESKRETRVYIYIYIYIYMYKRYVELEIYTTGK